MPTQDGGRAPLDHFDLERTRRDGTLLSARNEHHEAFASQLALALEPAGPRAWHVRGTLGTRAMAETFVADAPTSYLRHPRDGRGGARRAPRSVRLPARAGARAGGPARMARARNARHARDRRDLRRRRAALLRALPARGARRGARAPDRRGGARAELGAHPLGGRLRG